MGSLSDDYSRRLIGPASGRFAQASRSLMRRGFRGEAGQFAGKAEEMKLAEPGITSSEQTVEGNKVRDQAINGLLEARRRATLDPQGQPAQTAGAPIAGTVRGVNTAAPTLSAADAQKSRMQFYQNQQNARTGAPPVAGSAAGSPALPYSGGSIDGQPAGSALADIRAKNQAASAAQAGAQANATVPFLGEVQDDPSTLGLPKFGADRANANLGANPTSDSLNKAITDFRSRDAVNPNIPVSPDGFAVWKQKNAPNDSGEDYDLRGAYEAGVSPSSSNGHFPDTFKKPNHPTFSEESKYSTPKNPGGVWGQDPFGKTTFTPSPWMASDPKRMSDLRSYMTKSEPNASLVIPAATGASPLSFLPSPLLAAYNKVTAAAATTAPATAAPTGEFPEVPAPVGIGEFPGRYPAGFKPTSFGNAPASWLSGPAQTGFRPTSFGNAPDSWLSGPGAAAAAPAPPTASPAPPLTPPSVVGPPKPSPTSLWSDVKADASDVASDVGQDVRGVGDSVISGTNALGRGARAVQGSIAKGAGALASVPSYTSTILPGRTGKRLKDMNIPGKIQSGVEALGNAGADIVDTPLRAAGSARDYFWNKLTR